MTKGTRPKKAEKTQGFPSVIPITDLDNLGAPAITTLNFRVSEAFHREFKMYAAQRGMNMVDLLQESFMAFKAQRER